jgi:ceramide glucosyltransferase
MHVLDSLALALTLVAAASLAVTLAAHGLTLVRLRREAGGRGAGGAAGGGTEGEAPTTRFPPISVLKPLKGADETLYANLAALARQDYPCFELVCGAERPDDPGLAVARRIAADFPAVPLRIVAGAAPCGLNPKVTNLASLARSARHEHLLISDADVRPGPAYLRALALELAGRDGGGPAGLVSSLLAGGQLAGPARPSAGALLDELHLGTFVASAVCGAAATRHPCVVGKSMLFRRSDLAAVGGWAAVADVLAEDYVLGRAFAAAGRRVALCAHVVPVVCGRRRVRDFLARHLRWCQMRCRLAPLAYAGEVLLNPVPSLLAAAALAAPLAARGEAAWAAVGVAALAGVATKVVADGVLLGRLGGPVPLSRLAWVPVKDLLVAGVWALAPFRRTVAWRGTRLLLGAGSRLSRLDRPAPAATARPALEEAR